MAPCSSWPGLAADVIGLAFIAVLVGAGVLAWRVRESNRIMMWALIALVVPVLGGSLLWTYMLNAP